MRTEAEIRVPGHKPGVGWCRQKPERHGEPSSSAFRGSTALPTLGFQTLASVTVREFLSVALSHPVRGALYSSPRKPLQPFSEEVPQERVLVLGPQQDGETGMQRIQALRPKVAHRSPKGEHMNTSAKWPPASWNVSLCKDSEEKAKSFNW